MVVSLLLSAMAWAQLTGVSPSTANQAIMVWPSGARGPVVGRVAITLTGTGTVSWTNDCFDRVKTSSPTAGTSATLPATVYAVYGWTAGTTCTITFIGGSGGNGTTAITAVAQTPSSDVIQTDMLGRPLSTLAHCSKSHTDMRVEDVCLNQEAEIKPGGDWAPPAFGASRIDATFGGRVTNQGAEYTRSYVTGNQISYDREWVVLWKRDTGKAVLHRVDAADSSADLYVSGSASGTKICSLNSTGNIGLGTTAATANFGFCLNDGGAGLRQIKKFSFTGGVLTDLGVIYTHGSNISNGLWGTGQAGADGWMSFMDTTQICVLNWMHASPSATCITGTYPPRNNMIGQFPSRSTGLHYIFSGSDNNPPTSYSRISSYSFNAATRTLAFVASEVAQTDFPNFSTAGTTWGNGACNGDCIPGAHHAVAFFNGEPHTCGSGQGHTQMPSYHPSGACIGGWGYNLSDGRTHDAVGGPVVSAVATVEDYYVGSKAPVLVYTDNNSGQGNIPAWRISSCTATAGTATCTVTGATLDTANLVDATTPILVEGFPETAFNGRFTVSGHTSTTFSYACPSCSGTTTSDVGNMTRDVAIATQMPAYAGKPRIMICRPGLRHCRSIAFQMSVSYGSGNAGLGLGTGSGTWYGFAQIGAIGFQALDFPTVGMWGERVCWVSDEGSMINIYAMCAPTGRPELGLPAFDLDENTPDNCFDRHGRCLTAASVAATSVSLLVNPTNPLFRCTVEVSARRDFATTAGSQTLAAPVGATGSATIGSLTANTQYYARAKCGLNSGEVWDYGVLPVHTK